MTSPSEHETDGLATIRAMVTDSVRFVLDLLGRIVNGIKHLAPIALGLGCQTPDASPAMPAVPNPQVATREISVASADAAVVDEGPQPIGQFNITFYYVIGEDEVPTKAVAANDNRKGSDDPDADPNLTDIAPPNLVTLFNGGGSCEPIASVSREFASELALQGTGKLHDGRVVNIWGACNCEHTPCFKVTSAQWGTAGSGKPLQPFRTVAVDPKVVKRGSLLYVPLLEGRTMPGRAPWGGFVHDGCVVADDTGGHIDGNRLDLFVGRKAYFLGLSGSGGSHAWARHVPVFDGSAICERKGRIVARKAGAI